MLHEPSTEYDTKNTIRSAPIVFSFDYEQSIVDVQTLLTTHRFFIFTAI